jgi:hypothetical protein
MFYTLVWILLGFGAVICLMLVLFFKSLEWKIRIRQGSSESRTIKDVLGKERRDDKGIPYIWVFGLKPPHNKLPIPPPIAVDHDLKKRKKVVEAYWSEDGGYTYLEDKESVKGFEPLETNQRIMLVQEYERAALRKQSVLERWMPVMVAGGTFVIILAVLLLFWGEAMQPMIEVGSQAGSITTMQNEIIMNQQELLDCKQVLNTQEGIG